MVGPYRSAPYLLCLPYIKNFNFWRKFAHSSCSQDQGDPFAHEIYLVSRSNLSRAGNTQVVVRLSQSLREKCLTETFSLVSIFGKWNRDCLVSSIFTCRGC